MNFTYQNNILYLPCVEGRSLQRGKSVSILFEVDASFIAGTKHPFNYDGSTPKYPTRVKKTSDENVIPEKYKIDLLNEKINENYEFSFEYAEFWHYLGDGTYHSELVPTPYRFKIGQHIIVENRYNVPPLEVKVEDIQLTRVDERNWFWLVTLSSLRN